MTNFGEGAARLCSIACQLLGWRPEEFWNATPAEIALILQPAPDAVEAPDQSTIEQLKRRFPDQERA